MNDDRFQASTQGTGSPIIVIPGLKWTNGLVILALTLSLLSLYVVVTRTNEAEREARLSEYYAVNLEMDLAKHGFQPPPDPWRQRKKEQKQ